MKINYCCLVSKFLTLAMPILSCGVVAYGESPYQVAWYKQLGTGVEDQSKGVTTDSLGNVLITGWTSGSLAGVNAGGRDAFVIKYDSSGQQLWSRQFGSDQDDFGSAIATDSFGNAYITRYRRPPNFPVSHTMCFLPSTMVPATIFGPGNWQRMGMIERFRSPSMDRAMRTWVVSPPARSDLRDLAVRTPL